MANECRKVCGLIVPSGEAGISGDDAGNSPSRESTPTMIENGGSDGGRDGPRASRYHWIASRATSPRGIIRSFLPYPALAPILRSG